MSELKSYLGLLAYYGNFLPNLSQALSPLYRLLKKSTSWKWSEAEELAFSKSKELLSSSSLLVHFDPKRPLVLACDASSHGIGVVLAHQMEDGSERPVAYASRTLSPAEKNYSQIEKEALSCIFGIKKFHTYLYGHHFTLVTDHKPLLSLFRESQAIPAHASARIQRRALTLLAYDYEIRFRSSTAHGNADALSRLPLDVEPTVVPTPPETILMMEELECSPVKASHVRRETVRNPVLCKVLQFVQSGWPDNCENDQMKPYWTRRTDLSLQDGCILWRNCVLVPPPLQKKVLEELHEGHPGIVKMKSLGRLFAWWPGFDQDVESVVKSCVVCQQHRPSPPAAPVHPWMWPSHPWSRVHIDYAGPYLNHRFLVIVDAHSKWIEAFAMSSTTSFSTIEKLRSVFARFGVPEMLVSDNGTNFTSEEFQQFCTKNGIKHVTTAPYHPSSNGLAECSVRILKEGLVKVTHGSIQDRLSRVLFSYHNTPLELTKCSPAELMMGRRL